MSSLNRLAGQAIKRQLHLSEEIEFEPKLGQTDHNKIGIQSFLIK